MATIDSDIEEQIEYVQGVLKAVSATILGKASRDTQSYSVAGRNLTGYTFSELIVLRDKFKSELGYLKRSKRLADGLPTGNQILVRM